ncbi:hypothetical protein TNCV_4357541 [Trichonephila clavipes]|nr:hypothetical protein TNCV_4357541 [Trichonephila clavipes]
MEKRVFGLKWRPIMISKAVVELGKRFKDKGGIEKLACKLPDFFKRIGIMKVRQSLRETEDQKTTKVKIKKRVVRKLRKSEIEFQKRCFKRRAKPNVTIRGDKALPRAYWDRVSE